MTDNCFATPKDGRGEVLDPCCRVVRCALRSRKFHGRRRQLPLAATKLDFTMVFLVGQRSLIFRVDIMSPPNMHACVLCVDQGAFCGQACRVGVAGSLRNRFSTADSLTTYTRHLFVHMSRFANSRLTSLPLLAQRQRRVMVTFAIAALLP